MKLILIFLSLTILAQAQGPLMSSPDQMESIDPESEVCSTQETLTSQVKEVVNLFQPCFDNRPNPSSKVAQAKFTDIDEVFASETRVCGCLAKKYNNKNRPKAITAEDVANNRLKILEKNLYGKQEQLDEIANGVAMQLKNVTRPDDYNGILESTMTTDNLVSREQAQLWPKVDDVLQKKIGIDISLDKNSAQFDKFLNLTQTIRPPTADKTRDFIKEEIAPNSCISRQMYYAYSQQPKDPGLLEEMRKPDFNDEDWKLEALKLKYDQAVKENKTEEVARLKTKITYLIQNPLHAGLLSAGPEHNQDKKEVLRLLSSKAECSDEKECLAAAVVNADIMKAKLTEIYKKDSVKGAVQWGTQQQMLKVYNKNSVIDLLHMDIPETRDQLEKAYQSITKQNISGCHDRMKAGAYEACERNFPRYCMQMEQLARMRKDKELLADPADARPSDVFDQLDFYRKDLKEDPGFKALSKELCDTKHMNANKEKMTFNEWKGKFCKSHTCGTTADQNLKLLRDFNKEFYQDENGKLINHPAIKDVVCYLNDQKEVDEAEVILSSLPDTSKAKQASRIIPRSTLIPPSFANQVAAEGEAASKAINDIVKEFPEAHKATSGSETSYVGPLADSAPVAPASSVSSAMATPVLDPKVTRAQAALSDEIRKLQDEKAKAEKDIADMKTKTAQEAAERRVSDLKGQIARKEEELKKVNEKTSASKTAKKDAKGSKSTAEQQADETDEDDAEEAPKTKAVAQKVQKDKETVAAQKRAAAAQEIAEEAANQAQHQAQTAQAQSIANSQSNSQGASAIGSSGNSSAMVSGSKEAVSGINSALLAKYVDAQKPLDTTPGPQQEPSAMMALLVKSSTESKVQVSQQQFDRLSNNDFDQKMLSELYLAQVKNRKDPVVRMKIEHDGKTIEVLAIRNAKDEVEFRPVPVQEPERKPASAGLYRKLKAVIKQP